jgi:hypothetical protein
MANLNLSQFGENTSVSDADWTFVWDSTALISKKVSRNSWLSGTTATFRLGLADAATAVAQTLSVQSVVAGTSNTAGANFSINGSRGTGTGAGGSLLLRTAPAGSSGTAQNALVTAVAITAAGNVGIGTTAPGAKLHVAGTIKPEQALMFPSISAGITLSTTHAGTIIISDAATDITVNLPAVDTEVNGFNVMIIQRGAGAVTIGANGNNLQSFGSAVKTAGQHAACSIVRTAANQYNLSGNLV